MKVEYTPAAVSQLNGISEYLRKHNPSAAVRIAEAIETAAASLATMPYVGRLQDVEDVRKKVVASTRFLIFYSVLTNQNIVRILAVTHRMQQRPFRDT